MHGFEDLQLNMNLGYDILESKYAKDVPDLAGMMYTANKKDGTGLDYDSKQQKRNTLLDLYANYQHTFAGRSITTPLFRRKAKNCSRRSTTSLSIIFCLCMDA